MKDHLKDINAALDKAFKNNKSATVTFTLNEQASTKKYVVDIKYKVLGLTINVQSDDKKSLLSQPLTLQLDSFVHHDKNTGKPYKLPHASVVSIIDITLEYAGHDNKTISLPGTTGIKFKKK